MTIPCDLQRHAEELRQAKSLPVDLLEEGNRICVVIHKHPLPRGLFRLAETDLLFIADHQYPVSPLDMFWTEIDVIRPTGAIPQAAQALETHVGRSWRRYSWHRNGTWNPNGNGLLDHLAFLEARWKVEVSR